MTTLVKRTTLIVRSTERSVAFYREVLGLSVWYDDRVTLSGVGLAAGARGDETHLVIMQASDPRRDRLGVGDIIFVMQGEDVDGVHDRAVAFGARIHAAPHRYEVRGADGAMLSMTSLSLWDPDDYFIEYNQRTISGG